MYSFHSVFTILLLVIPVLAGLSTPEDLVAAYSLTVSTTLPFPTATLSSSGANDFVISSWTLNGNKVQNQPSDLAFVPDPFPTSSSSSPNATSPVMQITYGSGSFGGDGGGVQFLSLFNGSISPQTMLLSYEVAFDKGFQFVKGGKLPGLRGGSNTLGCEGGSQPNGTDCWSTRLMWRTAGAGEGMSTFFSAISSCHTMRRDW
jgi:Polysaccharide lyase 14